MLLLEHQPRPDSRHLRAQLFNSHRIGLRFQWIFFQVNFDIGNEEGRELVYSRSIPIFLFIY